MRAALAIVLVGGAAFADPANLDLERQPVKLAMRPKQVAIATPIATPAPLVTVPAPIPAEDVNEPAKVRDLQQRVAAQVDLGYVVDGTTALQNPANATGFGSTVASDQRREFATTRAYGFGEGFVSTHGVGYDSLSTYFNAQFQAVAQTQTYAPLEASANKSGLVGEPNPIATWFDRSGFEARAAYAELRDFMPQPYLAPLRVRAGELYVYGPWALHIYGGNAAWDGTVLHANVYAGSLVPDYTIDPTLPVDRAGVLGGNVRIDLDPAVHVPLSVEVQSLALTSGTNTDSTNHLQAVVAYKTDRISVQTEFRALSGRWVNERLNVRARYSDVTNLVVDVSHSSADDWLWDPTVLDNDPVAARRYLDLGPVLPQWLVSARAGTLIAENVDVFARGAASIVDDSNTQTAYTPSYVEGGAAVELRLRRRISLGASILTRENDIDDPAQAEILDHPNVADPIPESASSQLGERGFTEIGTTARMTLGARKFSLLVEVYGRRTRYALDYCAVATVVCPADDTGIQTVSFRGGGRAQVDAWIGQRLRLFASYEISSALDFEPEITGYKSLRLMMEGRY
ncbi:MAG TPA: hypothetical protein VH143_08490 [Kofleriaceae bacterium]|nr:hypothetical protein [Kofleriaceae bacterium]